MTKRAAAMMMTAMVLVAGGLALTPSAIAGKPARVAATSLIGGINVENVWPLPLSEADSTIAAAKRLHASVVRTEVSWAMVEPEPGAPSSPTLAFMDRLVADAASDGIKVVLSVDSSPCWASAAPQSLLAKCRPGGLAKANGWPPRDPDDYAAFVAFLAKRYGSRLAAIEVWNEPDQQNENYFAGPDKPARYAAVLKAAYTAIKAQSPETSVLAGAFVGSNGVFLKDLYAAGIKGYYDGLAVHFYTLTLADLRYTHQIQLENGDETPMWLNEFGWSSCWPRQKVQQEQGCVTNSVQAANIETSLREIATSPYVRAALVYELRGSRAEDFGMLAGNGSHKLAYSALASTLLSLNGPVAAPTLHLKRIGGSIVASGHGPVGDYMYMEVFKGSVLRFRADFTLDRFNKYSVRLPSVLGTQGLRVRVYQGWLGSARSAQRST